MAEDGINYLNVSNHRAITSLLLRLSLRKSMCIITSWSYKLSISFMKFHLLLTKLNLRMEKVQSKGNYSSITDNTLMILRAHNHIIVIYTQY